MSNAKITLIGFYKLFDSLGDDLFKFVKVPEGLDKETLCDNILLRGGEFEVLYSDPDFLQLAIKTWSNKHQRTFEKWFNALSVEYNPLENYDRIEEWTDNETNSNNFNSNDNSNGNSTTNNKVSAFNSSALEPESSEDSTNNVSSSTTSTNNGSVDSIHKGRLHGNIGVTTSQQMLQSELEIARWNIYEQITDLFLLEFAIPIY